MVVGPSIVSSVLRVGRLLLLSAVMAFCVSSASAQIVFDKTEAANKRLFEAVRKNDLAAVQASITAGADVNAMNAWGLTPSDVAVDKGHFDIAHLLLSLRDIKGKNKATSNDETDFNVQPQLLQQSEGDSEPEKKVRYGVISRKKTRSKKSPLAPRIIPNAPVARAESTPKASQKPKAPSWPKGQPNPFDPDYVAADSTLEVISSVDQSNQGANFADPPQKSKAPKKGFLDRVTGVFSSTKVSPPLSKPVHSQSIPNLPKVEQPVAMPSKNASGGPALFTSPLKRPDFQQATPQSTPSASKPSAEMAPIPPFKKEENFKAGIMRSLKSAPGVTSAAATASTGVAVTKGAMEMAAPDGIEAEAPRNPDEVLYQLKNEPIEQGQYATLPTPVKPEEKGFMDNVVSFLTFGLLDDEKKPQPSNAPIKLAPDPMKRPPVMALPVQNTPAVEAESSPSLVKSAQNPQVSNAAGWSVKDVQTVKPSKPMPVRSSKKSLPEKYLEGIELSLGHSVKLGSALRKPEEKGSKFSKVCIEKNSGSVAFCIKPVDWPAEVEPLVLVGTVMYTGLKTIVRYDEGRASRFHSLFPSESYVGLVAYYSRRYGKPTQSMKRSIAPLAARRQDNPTSIWRNVNPVTKQVTTLEVRKFDDTRGGFPDTDRGAIMLYNQWSKPIFPQLSTVELMLLRPNEVL